MRLLAAVIVGCAILFVPRVAWPADAAQNVGLSKSEAVTVATRFFAEEIAVSGGVGEPSLKGDYWVFPVKFGYSAHVAADPILVNRITGKASWAGLAAHNAARGHAAPRTPK